MTVEQKIKTLRKSELAAFIEKLGFGRETPWSQPFKKLFCDKCKPLAKVGKTLVYECDFVDGQCPHPDPIEWWLQQEWSEGLWLD